MNDKETRQILSQMQEFLDEISAIQNLLTTPGILGKFPDEQQKQEFKKFRIEWKKLVNQTRIDLASILVSELQANEVELNKGINAIAQEIQQLDDTVAFLNLLGKTVEILQKIIIV